MNTEELKQLKRGDEIFIRAKFVRVFDDGDVLFTHTNTNGDEEVVKTEEYTHSGNVIIPAEVQPAPKYDPCRRFKKGDKVRVVERHGRKYWKKAPKTLYTVAEDEYPPDDPNALHRGRVGINDGRAETLYSWNIPFYHLELVTPVEELEPYSVGESTDYFSVEKDDKELCLYWKDSHQNPKAAAEAECKRLNEEYRKEVCNG